MKKVTCTPLNMPTIFRKTLFAIATIAILAGAYSSNAKAFIANSERLNDVNSIKSKTSEYRTWLQKHKTDSIHIPRIN